MSSNDPDLACLVADMSVAQTPVPRRMGGVGVRTHFNDNDQGTSEDSTVTGVPVTLLLNGISAKVSLINGQTNEEGTHDWCKQKTIQDLCHAKSGRVIQHFLFPAHRTRRVFLYS
jgi:hypothetical protein